MCISDSLLLPADPTLAAAPDPLREATSGSALGAFAILAYGLSAGSQRQYRHTFALWLAFCQRAGSEPGFFEPRERKGVI